MIEILSVLFVKSCLHTGNFCLNLLWSDFNSEFLKMHNNLWNQNKFWVEDHQCGVIKICDLKRHGDSVHLIFDS